MIESFQHFVYVFLSINDFREVNVHPVVPATLRETHAYGRTLRRETTLTGREHTVTLTHRVQDQTLITHLNHHRDPTCTSRHPHQEKWEIRLGKSGQLETYG